MRRTLAIAWLTASLLPAACGDSGNPGGPTSTVTTTTAPPTPTFQIQTLITVYRSASAFAEWSQGTTSQERLGEILLNVTELTPGTTILNNEEGRVALQSAIDRMNESFAPADFQELFDESQENLLRFLNDADNDGWSVDGRHGLGRDWPHDSDGNDPDGWTAQIIVIVVRPGG